MALTPPVQSPGLAWRNDQWAGDRPLIVADAQTIDRESTLARADSPKTLSSMPVRLGGRSISFSLT
jgi:hypothetical protein